MGRQLYENFRGRSSFCLASCSPFIYSFNYLMAQNDCSNSDITATFQPSGRRKEKRRSMREGPEKWQINWDVKNEQELAKGRVTRKSFPEELRVCQCQVWKLGGGRNERSPVKLAHGELGGEYWRGGREPDCSAHRRSSLALKIHDLSSHYPSSCSFYCTILLYL